MRCNETGAHLHRTQNYVRSLALHLRQQPRFAVELNGEAIDLLYKSAPLHDIGKVGIPDSILLKPGHFDPHEFEEMKQHPRLGYQVLENIEHSFGAPIDFLRIAKEIVLCHHEKWDGSGYPQGLRGETIPLSARLMAVADVYDAVISRRVYKPKMSHKTAVAIIREGSGSHFDPAIVRAFLCVENEFLDISQRYS